MIETLRYTDVLLREMDRRFYIGAARDPRARVAEHTAGRVRSTTYRRPLCLVYYEACLDADDGCKRERYLKSGRGGRDLKQRLSSWLAGPSVIKSEHEPREQRASWS